MHDVRLFFSPSFGASSRRPVDDLARIANETSFPKERKTIRFREMGRWGALVQILNAKSRRWINKNSCRRLRRARRNYHRHLQTLEGMRILNSGLIGSIPKYSFSVHGFFFVHFHSFEVTANSLFLLKINISLFRSINKSGLPHHIFLHFPHCR